MSRGLIAEVVLHKRKTEGRTGGDFGLVITRPSVEKQFDSFLVKNDYRRGLLCQAKLKKSDGKWGKLTNNQIEKLPKSLSCLGLLLYDYEDLERHKLRSFRWQLCNKASDIADVVGWLNTGIFPSALESKKAIEDLGESRIGTDDQKVLDEIIAPEGNVSLEIIIKWNDDSKKPGSKIYVMSRNEVVNTQKVHVR